MEGAIGEGLNINGGIGIGVGMGVGVINGANDSALQEARQLIDAIQEQNRGGISATVLNDKNDERDTLPCFFVITAAPSVEVRSAPSNTSALIRIIKKVKRFPRIASHRPTSHTSMCQIQLFPLSLLALTDLHNPY